MRIGVFTTLFPYKKPFNEVSVDIENYIRGGVGEAVYNLSLRLAQLGHEIYVFTTSADSKDHIEEYKNITIFRYGRRFKIADTDISLSLLNGALKHDLDIVHLHLGSPPATLAALRYIKKRKKPFVVTHHLDPEWNYGSIIRRVLVFIYAKYYVKKALSRSDVVIALSENFLNMSKFLSDYRTKIEIIPNGINSEDFDIPCTKIEARERLGLSPDDAILLFVGSLTERKGPQVLLRAMPMILRDTPDTRVVIVGSSTGYLKSLEKLAHELGIESNIEFTGFVDDATKVMYYKSADVFVLPSFSEAFPIVILEASVCGLPLVVSNLEVFRTIVEDGHNGIFTKTGDENDLAGKITHLLKNEDVRKKMGENGRKKIEDYSWDRIAAETEKVYKETEQTLKDNAKR